MYADYNYYKEVYGGYKVSRELFNLLEKKVSMYLDEITLNRIPEDVPARVKEACCALIDLCFLKDSRLGVSSEGNDTIKVNYDSEALATEILKTAIYYLEPTGLLYRGMDNV